MKNILITGGAGSVGRELAANLVGAGYSIRALDLPQCDFRPLEALGGVEVLRGSIDDADLLRRACADVEAVVHLAALLPPASECDCAVTMAVNVGGTENLVRVLERENPGARFIFSSSVCVYGDTTADEPPVHTARVLAPLDIYGQSKVRGEEVIRGSALPYTILRIGGVSVPAFLALPDVWPFTAEQRMEFVCRSDVVAALAACVETPAATGKVLNIAGGPTWQMRGCNYAARLSELMGLDPDEACYSARPGSYDWYDTSEAQALLGYQQTSFEGFIERLEQAIMAALGEA